MTKPPPAGAAGAPPVRPDRYRCPVCEHWRGEHMKTGLLARHGAPGGSPYELCQGSLRSLRGLHARAGDRALPPRYSALYSQPPLFTDP